MEDLREILCTRLKYADTNRCGEHESFLAVEIESGSYVRLFLGVLVRVGEGFEPQKSANTASI
jgi:hypothetical protein